jgi:hypothetical protein
MSFPINWIQQVWQLVIQPFDSAEIDLLIQSYRSPNWMINPFKLIAFVFSFQMDCTWVPFLKTSSTTTSIESFEIDSS